MTKPIHYAHFTQNLKKNLVIVPNKIIQFSVNLFSAIISYVWKYLVIAPNRNVNIVFVIYFS